MKKVLTFLFISLFITGCEDSNVIDINNVSCDSLRKNVYKLVGKDSAGKNVRVLSILPYEEVPYTKQISGTVGVIKCKGAARLDSGNRSVIEYEVYTRKGKVFIKWRELPESQEEVEEYLKQFEQQI